MNITPQSPRTPVRGSTAPSATTRPIVRILAGVASHTADELAIEEPLEIRIGNDPLAVTMRTPGNDSDLAAGFCLTEGIVEQADEIERIETCRSNEQGNVILVHLSDEAMSRRAAQIACAKRELFISSSCGICGKQSIDRIEKIIMPLNSNMQVPAAWLTTLPARMRKTQATFETTGGLHAAAVFDAQGDVRILREDVGRHNAVDKVIGAALLTGQLPLRDCVLLVSGRASFELVQKAAMAGIAMLAAVGAPSSLAVDLASRVGMTLIGFLRDERMNVYHGMQRVVV